MDNDLLALLKTDLQNARLLATLLDSERTELESRRYESLSALMRRKAELLAALEKNNERVRQLLSDTGFSHDSQGILAYCETLDRTAGTDTASQFRELQTRLTHCREMNLINASIVHRTKLHTGTLLDILRGKKAGQSLYTAEGSSSANPAIPRTLGSA
jgi:flagellar biosynthesis/type III secretory pathway chaperone